VARRVHIIQSLESHPKDQQTRHVKRGPVVPLLRLQRRLSAVAVLVQPLDQQVDLLGDHRLLLTDGGVGEAVGQTASQAPVLLATFVDDVSWDGVDGTRKFLRLGHFRQVALAADVVAVNILESLSVAE